MTIPYYGKNLSDQLIGNVLTSDNSATITQPWLFKSNVTMNGTLTVNDPSIFKNDIEIQNNKNLRLIGGSIYSNSIQAIDANGVAFRAKYADYAEYYEADKEYLPGTVISIGGEKEITLATDKGRVFGVISTNPAFVCNSEKKDNGSIVLPVCCIGRIPCLVNGIVKKGDKITFDKDGIARVYNDNDIINHNVVIGISLKNKNTEETGLVEIVSRINF